MEIKSTKILQTLSFESIFQLEGKVRSIVVVSAYTDTEFIKKVIQYMLEHGNQVDKPHFSIYLDYHASGYSSSQTIKNELDDVVAILADKFDDDSGVYLVKAGCLFHSKCIISQSRGSLNLLLGSVNFTENGFSQNEELVLNGQAVVDGKSHTNQLVNQILDYVDSLSSVKVGSDEISCKPLSLRQVLLDGVMYYEQKENDPLRFSLNIPDAIRDVNQEINPLLGAKINNSISLEHIVSNTDELKIFLKEKSSSKVSWKKFCIETCYGFWAPEYERENIDNVIEKKFRVRFPYYKSLFEVIDIHKDVIKRKFSTVANDIERYVVRQKKIEINGDSLKWSAEEALAEWGEWYERLEEKLESDEFRKRIIVGIISAAVPNVWSDKLSATDFEESFAESLQYYCVKGQIASGRHAANSFIAKHGLRESHIVNCRSIKQLVRDLNAALKVAR